MYLMENCRFLNILFILFKKSDSNNSMKDSMNILYIIIFLLRNIVLHNFYIKYFFILFQTVRQIYLNNYKLLIC